MIPGVEGLRYGFGDNAEFMAEWALAKSIRSVRTKAPPGAIVPAA